MKKLIVCILTVLMMVPVLAFAEDSHQINEINLVNEGPQRQDSGA